MMTVILPVSGFDLIVCWGTARYTFERVTDGHIYERKDARVAWLRIICATVLIIEILLF